jgi:hypothetical protein
MKTCAAITLLAVSQGALASDCDLILQRFVSILTEKGELAEGNNTYTKNFHAEEFDESCQVIKNDKKYVLYLHPDDISIVVSSKVESTGKTIYQGPFFSAYKK